MNGVFKSLLGSKAQVGVKEHVIIVDVKAISRRNAPEVPSLVRLLVGAEAGKERDEKAQAVGKVSSQDSGEAR